jgi:hypothetical protein
MRGEIVMCVSVRCSESFYNLGSQAECDHFSHAPSCGFPSTRLESASLRGAHALLDPTFSTIPRLLLRHIQLGTISRTRHRLESILWRLATFR